MKIADNVWTRLASLLKARLLAKYDPGILSPDASGLESKLEIQHQGCYISVYDSKNDKMARACFLTQGCQNILESTMQVLNALHTELEAKGVSHKKLSSSSYNFAVVWDLFFIENSLAWDANTDGIYLNWGDKYKGLYLPYEIRKMSVTKAEVLNRLCSWELGIPSNLWRLPEGMTYKISCDSYSI